MMNSRPTPDELLAQVTAEERKSARGKLKIFFGSSAGVGKTYAMLEEARKRAAEGADVLIGYAEQHIRPETESLLLGLEILPYKIVEYKGASLKEFDLDAALARKPTLVCVDELAHSNAPGLRHTKRYQDVLELLDAGINVYTSLNVQHLESVNDVVERISGIKVRETLPDRIFEQADDVQLIDIPPDKLIERIAEGKIYRQHNIDHLTKQFFNKGNLSALRELALRRTADRVDAQMEDFRRENSVNSSWPTAERLLVCVGPSPFAEQLVRAARRMSAAQRSPWIAVCVETPAMADLPAEARERIAKTLRLAESLGAQTVTLAGTNPAEEIIAYAHSKNVARIVLGKPVGPRWKELLRGSFVDDVIRKSGAIDVYVIRDEAHVKPHSPRSRSSQPVSWAGYGWSVAITAATAALGLLLYHRLGIANTNVLMIDLLAVLVVALRFGRGPAIVGSILSVAAFDYTVVPPYFSFDVSDSQYLITFLVMLLTALVMGTLADRLQRQTDASRRRERRTAALLDLAKELAATPDKAKIVQAAVTHISQVFSCQAIVLLVNPQHKLVCVANTGDASCDDEKEQGVIQWVFDHGQMAGATTDTLPFAKGLYLPLQSTRGVLGVLGVFATDAPALSDPDRLHLLEAFANQTASAVERATSGEDAQQAWERVEAEFIRNTLLSGVSHDLRTPLAVITGSATTLLESGAAAGADVRDDLLHTIASEAAYMDRFVNNLLDMTRLESGGLQLKKELHPLEEIIGSALQRLKTRLEGRSISVEIRNNLPLVSVDETLFQQVLINLLDNAVEYTSPTVPIHIRADADAQWITLIISDEGPGLPVDAPARVFQKFYRSASGSNHRGIGLGLAICKGIVELHGGTITAGNRAGIHGAEFTISLPNISGQASLNAQQDSSQMLT